MPLFQGRVFGSFFLFFFQTSSRLLTTNSAFTVNVTDQLCPSAVASIYTRAGNIAFSFVSSSGSSFCVRVEPSVALYSTFSFAPFSFARFFSVFFFLFLFSRRN